MAILAGSRGGRLVASSIRIAGDRGGRGFNVKAARAAAKEVARLAAATEALGPGDARGGGRGGRDHQVGNSIGGGRGTRT